MNEEALLKKIASRAKRKLNKQAEEETIERRNNPECYCFKKYDSSAEVKKLEKKIALILKNNPDCLDPIGRLIDHSVYDNLSPEQKQAYILKLSTSYREISERLQEAK